MELDFDIDYFKKVNDAFGHDIGDIVLIEFVNHLKNNIRDVDYLGRWGGEEFLLVCPKMNETGLEKLAEKLRKKIEEAFFTKTHKMTASFGISMSKDKSSIKQMIKYADIALYKAKHEGRNRVYFKV